MHVMSRLAEPVEPGWQKQPTMSDGCCSLCIGCAQASTTIVVQVLNHCLLMTRRYCQHHVDTGYLLLWVRPVIDVSIGTAQQVWTADSMSAFLHAMPVAQSTESLTWPAVLAVTSCNCSQQQLNVTSKEFVNFTNNLNLCILLLPCCCKLLQYFAALAIPMLALPASAAYSLRLLAACADNEWTGEVLHNTSA